MKPVLHILESPACDGEEEPVERKEQEMSLAEQTELPVPVEMSTESSTPTLPELDNDDLEDKVQIENTEEGDVQGYLAEDEHLSAFVRLDDCNEASGDYTCGLRKMVFKQVSDSYVRANY
ncbi:hypothetical protein AALO_G00162970 [Alosa alosa]|uniref:Uncharacterized protein n=1 Tax=Alosa alosa TaxID=278164 RepID=A0AAV6GDQ5_9TELE|nr:hypothetical protein AALO_G00162970 [Alosa alosa]